MHCKLGQLAVVKVEYKDGNTFKSLEKQFILKDFKDSHVEPQEFMLQRALHFAAQYIREGALEVRIVSTHAQ